MTDPDPDTAALRAAYRRDLSSQIAAVIAYRRLITAADAGDLDSVRAAFEGLQATEGGLSKAARGALSHVRVDAHIAAWNTAAAE